MAIHRTTRLPLLTQPKVNNSNDEALRGAEGQRALIGKQKQMREDQRTFQELTRPEQGRAAEELQLRLPAFRRTLSHGAAALLDQWVDWAGLHR